MSNSYRCYFTDESDRIRSHELIECPDDAAAVLKVDELLARSEYNCAELWRGPRLVGKWGTNGHRQRQYFAHTGLGHDPHRIDADRQRDRAMKE